MAADCPDCQSPLFGATHRARCLAAVGGVTHAFGVHTARCAREDCPWVFETPKDGDAAHALVEHNAAEHGS